MAASTLSFGMLAPRAFCRARRSAGLSLGFGPPAFTAMAMSLLMRVKTLAILFHRANMVALRVSKMRPMKGRIPHGSPPAQAPRGIPSRAGDPLQTYQRQRLGVFALAAAFLGLMGILVLGYDETRAAHERVTRSLDLESHLSFSRVWINRGSTEVLASILSGVPGDGAALEGDRVRARAELQAIRDLVGSDPSQVARLDELAGLLERRFAMEKGAVE